MKKTKNGMIAFTVYMTPEMVERVRGIASNRSYTISENNKRVSAAEIVRRCVDKAIGRIALQKRG